MFLTPMPACWNQKVQNQETSVPPFFFRIPCIFSRMPLVRYWFQEWSNNMEAQGSTYKAEYTVSLQSTRRPVSTAPGQHLLNICPFIKWKTLCSHLRIAGLHAPFVSCGELTCVCTLTIIKRLSIDITAAWVDVAGFNVSLLIKTSTKKSATECFWPSHQHVKVFQRKINLDGAYKNCNWV